jgi:cell division control protein 6
MRLTGLFVTKNKSIPLPRRRFSDIIGFLDLYGLINARVISKGRYGNTREIFGSLTGEVVGKLLKGGTQ